MLTICMFVFSLFWKNITYAKRGDMDWFVYLGTTRVGLVYVCVVFCVAVSHKNTLKRNKENDNECIYKRTREFGISAKYLSILSLMARVVLQSHGFQQILSARTSNASHCIPFSLDCTVLFSIFLILKTDLI